MPPSSVSGVWGDVGGVGGVDQCLPSSVSGVCGGGVLTNASRLVSVECGGGGGC